MTVLTGARLDNARWLAGHLQDPDPSYDTARQLALETYSDLLETVAYWQDTCAQLMESA